MTGVETPWRRLSIRTFYLALLRALIAMVPGYLGLVVLNDGSPVWVLVAGSFFGLLGSLGDLARWQTTRYRITPDRVEMRTGWLARKHRTVGRDRIRSVDSTARGLSRLLGLRTVHVGSGETQSSFQLNALDAGHAERLQQELMHGTRTADPAAAEQPVAPETVIARLRPGWIPLNVVTGWAPLVAAGPLVAAYWFLRPFGIDLLAFGRGLLDWSPPLIVVAVLIAYPIGIALQAGTFLLEWWKFELVRAGTPPATALVTRRGLINTQTVSRDDDRMRGIAVAEPLWWRWLHLAETRVISTGLRLGGPSPTSKVLPRIRLAEARDLAARILPDGHRPLAAPLRRHPRGALVRRLLWALCWPAVLAGALLLFAASGALPYWPALLPFGLLPLTVPLAVAAYRALGHANAGPYLVVRRGPLTRSTVALQNRAVIGWTFQQSLFQRRGNRIDVTVATAAGERAYHAYDLSVDQAVTFARTATPHLAAQFLEPGDSVAGSTARHRRRRAADRNPGRAVGVTTERQLRVIRDVVALLRANDIPAWLYGGWGLDARIGRITREHGDVKFWVQRVHADRSKELLVAAGAEAPATQPPTESCEFTWDGVPFSTAYFERHPDGSFSQPLGRFSDWLFPPGSFGDEPVLLDGTPVLAMSVAGMLAMKEQFPRLRHGRPWRPKDIADMAVLRDLAAAESGT